MNEIKPCICPNCGKEIPFYWENKCAQDADGDYCWYEYFIHCNCGTKFYYTEYYELTETKIELIRGE